MRGIALLSAVLAVGAATALAAAAGGPRGHATGSATAALQWVGFADRVGPSFQPKPDGHDDGHFRLTINLSGQARVTEIMLRTADAAGNPCCGQYWNTKADVHWILGVYRNGVRLNPTDHAISDVVSGQAVYDLFGADSGYFKKGQGFIVTVTIGRTTLSARTVIGAATPTRFSFRTYANNVRILPPLVGDWQLGVARIQGSGTLSLAAGTITGGFVDTDVPMRPKYRSSSVTAQIVSARYTTVGEAERIVARVRITASSNRTNCPVGSVGTLTIWDDPATLGNGQSADRVYLGGWPNQCGHVHGWSNEDRAGVEPPRGGPGGGNRAVVTIR